MTPKTLKRTWKRDGTTNHMSFGHGLDNLSRNCSDRNLRGEVAELERGLCRGEVLETEHAWFSLPHVLPFDTPLMVG